MSKAYERVVIVGVGLIGGSIGLGAKKRGLASEIVGVVRSESSQQRAKDSGAVDATTTDLAAAAAAADVVVVCTPVSQITGHLLAAAAACPEGALLTDAGSTKGRIVEQTEAGLAKLDAPPAFVGSHPLAGDHRTGPEAARDDLLVGRRVVITPSNNSPAAAIERTHAFWQALGAETLELAPEAHDQLLARTSHLPHLVASALAAATPEAALPLAATGWRDTTRVAGASATLWRDILLANREESLAALHDFQTQLTAFADALASDDAQATEQLLEQGRQRRDAVGD